MNQTIRQMIDDHKNALLWFEQNQIDNLRKSAALIADCFKSGNKVMLCGNGGSAADCQHIAGEFIGRFRTQRNPLPAISLTADSSVLTCLGNDYGFDEVFARQTAGLAVDGDVLWAFSTSGRSENILRAVSVAKSKGCKVLAFVGKPDAPLSALADIAVCSGAELTSAAQEIHMLAYHIICHLVEQIIKPTADRK